MPVGLGAPEPVAGRLGREDLPDQLGVGQLWRLAASGDVGSGPAPPLVSACLTHTGNAA